MSPDEMFALAAGLGEAKNRQCVDDALQYMHDEIELQSPAWGTVARGKTANRLVLERFFAAYPDYRVSFDGWVADTDTFVGWGWVQMTMSPAAREAVGQRPNGRRISVPVTIRMTFRDGLIATEHFSCDLAQISAQSGVSIDLAYRNVFGDAAVHSQPNGED